MKTTRRKFMQMAGLAITGLVASNASGNIPKQINTVPKHDVFPHKCKWENYGNIAESSTTCASDGLLKSTTPKHINDWMDEHVRPTVADDGKIQNGQIWKAPWPLCHEVVVLYMGRGDQWVLLYHGKADHGGTCLNVCRYERDSSNIEPNHTHDYYHDNCGLCQIEKRDNKYNPIYTKAQLAKKLDGWTLTDKCLQKDYIEQKQAKWPGMGINDGKWHWYVYKSHMNGRSAMYLDGDLNMEIEFNQEYNYQTAMPEVVYNSQGMMVEYKQWIRRVV